MTAVRRLDHEKLSPGNTLEAAPAPVATGATEEGLCLPVAKGLDHKVSILCVTSSVTSRWTERGYPMFLVCSTKYSAIPRTNAPSMTRSSINLARTSALRRLAPLDLAQQDLGDHPLPQQPCPDQQPALLARKSGGAGESWSVLVNRGGRSH